MPILNADTVKIYLSILEYELEISPSFKAELSINFINKTENFLYRPDNAWFSIDDWNRFDKSINLHEKNITIADKSSEINIKLENYKTYSILKLTIDKQLILGNLINLNLKYEHDNDIYSKLAIFSSEVKEMYDHYRIGS